MDDHLKIKIKKGLDLPLKGTPSGEVKLLPLPDEVALDLSFFETLLFTLLKKEGEEVRVGEPLVVDKKCPGRVFVSPGSGKIKEIIRGERRRILSIVIETDHKQTPFRQEKGSIDTLMEGGLFPHILFRPCERIAHPNKKPEVIFVKAIESAPFAPPAELQVQGKEELFQAGLEGLKALAPLHIVTREGSSCELFTKPSYGEVHFASGPHPIGNVSLHIAAIHPIKRNDQCIWVLSTSDVVAIGMWLKEGTYYAEKVIGVGGEGIPEEKRGFYRANRGVSLESLIGKTDSSIRVISGDPLNGSSNIRFLGFHHNVVCAFPEREGKREFLPFLKMNRKGYTASKGYFFQKKFSSFTTRQHGEERAFIDGAIYDRVMPLKIETMPLIKMFLARDYEKGEAMGLLEIAPEDFSLPAFICLSKIEMPEIVKEGLQHYTEQYLDE